MSEGSNATANDAQIGRSWRNYGRRRRSGGQDGMSVRCDQRHQMRSAVAKIRVTLGRWRAWPFLIWRCRSAIHVPKHLEDRRWTRQRSTSHESGMVEEEHNGRGRHHHRGIVLWPLAQRWDKASWQRRPRGNRGKASSRCTLRSSPNDGAATSTDIGRHSDGNTNSAVALDASC